MSDVVARPCPLTEDEAARALDSLSVSRSFERLADPEAARANAHTVLVDVAAASERLPPAMLELELNPVVVTERHAMIVDAVAFLGST